MDEKVPQTRISWTSIESQLGAIRPVKGGYSLAKRGLLDLPDGKTVFVKIGTAEDTKRWVQKELMVYEYLKGESYSFVPGVLSKNADRTGFALEALLPEEGWSWSEEWTTERLDATLAAMDALALLHPTDKLLVSPSETAVDTSRNGWNMLVESAELQARLLDKLEKSGHEHIAKTIDLQRELERSLQFTLRRDTLVHYDVRSDNCAWNSEAKRVKLVDWNWAQLGDTRIDTAAALVNIQRSGFDVSAAYANRLDADALQWLTGFWLRGAATPIWKGGSESLRDLQLESGLAAMYLLRQLNNV